MQIDVIGALIVRELQTRFGRDNIGVLWVLAEPLLFAGAITLLHMKGGGHMESGMTPAAFTLTGYGPYIIMRGIVSRGESVIEANGSLLYHRQVTLFDMLIARALLESAAVSTATLFLLVLVTLLGLANLPDRPLLLLAGVFLITWFSFALSMMIGSAAAVSTVVSRFVHPFTYLMLPVSGAFFLMKWIPEPYRYYISWIPFPHMFELIREGQFGSFESEHMDIPYVLAWCMGLTLLGLLALRIVRHRVHMD